MDRDVSVIIVGNKVDLYRVFLFEIKYELYIPLG